MAWYPLLLIAIVLHQTLGHGSLNEPPSRGSAWRHGFPTEPDYDDDGANCGGFGVQWQSSDGHCGICGDPWHSPIPRTHELGGTYGTGVIVRTYVSGAVIPILVNLTTCHKGFWELRLCTDSNRQTQDCFQDIIPQINGDTRFYPDVSRVYELEYKLPDGVTCEHCVIQWWYIAGNNWGICEDGTGSLGCGRQENFRACADVEVVDNGLKGMLRENDPLGIEDVILNILENEEFEHYTDSEYNLHPKFKKVEMIGNYDRVEKTNQKSSLIHHTSFVNPIEIDLNDLNVKDDDDTASAQ